LLYSLCLLLFKLFEWFAWFAVDADKEPEQSCAVKQKGGKSCINLGPSIKVSGLIVCALFLLMMSPALVQAQFEFIPYNYTTNYGKITILGYTGPDSAVAIPATIRGLPVGAIGDNAFAFKGTLTSITIPDSVTTIGISAFDFCSGLRTVTIGSNVNHIRSFAFRLCQGLTNVVLPGSITNIGYNAFFGCNSLTTIYFKGNTPSLEDGAFTFAPATIYYKPGTIGWQPRMLATADSLSVRTNGFGFSIAGTRGLSIVVEASTSFSNPVWFQMGSYTLTDNPLELIDLSWTNKPACFYRAGSVAFGGLPMSLSPL